MEYRSLLSILDLTNAEVDRLLDAADVFYTPIEAGGFKCSALRATSAILLFYEASTRTRSSFELAGKMLGVDTINISGKGSAIEKGETVKDTAITLDAMDHNMVIMRHMSADAVELFSRHFSRATLNAGSGRGQHPTQALLDAVSMRRRNCFAPGKRIAIVGDLKHSRVMRSNVQLLVRRGMDVVLVAPPQLMPDGWEALKPDFWHTDKLRDRIGAPDDPRLGNVTWETDFDRAIEGLDIVMMLRVQRERMAGGHLTNADEYSKLYGLTRRRIARLKDDATIMHPGPVNRGVEVGEDVFTDPRCVIADQVTAGVALRCALLCWACGKLDEALAEFK